MTAYRDPDFNERVALSRAAKEKALEQLRAKPKPSADELASRKAAAAERDAIASEKRRQQLAERQAEAEAAKAAEPVIAPPKSESERKAERDARYAARKARK
jgi:hypothetical protein